MSDRDLDALDLSLMDPALPVWLCVPYDRDNVHEHFNCESGDIDAALTHADCPAGLSHSADTIVFRDRAAAVWLTRFVDSCRAVRSLARQWKVDDA